MPNDLHIQEQPGDDVGNEETAIEALLVMDHQNYLIAP